MTLRHRLWSLLTIASMLLSIGIVSSAGAAELSRQASTSHRAASYTYDGPGQHARAAITARDASLRPQGQGNAPPAMARPMPVNQLASGFAAEAGGDAATTAGKDVTTYYPPNREFLGASAKQTLEAGTRIDRYGGEGGSFASPEGTPAAMRALRPGTDLTNLNTYEVVSPFEVDAGTAAPWFGQLGLGTQYELPSSVADLLDGGLLKAVR